MLKSADFGTNPNVSRLTLGKLFGLSASFSPSLKWGS